MESMSAPTLTLRPACSSKPSLQPHFDTIAADCEPWILSFTAPASHAASQFWLDCAFPLFTSLVYANCATARVTLLTKLMTWFFVSDSDDDNPSVLGCEDELVLDLRHELLLKCYAGKLHRENLHAVAVDICKGSLTCREMSARESRSGGRDESFHKKITKGLDALQGFWKDIYKDLSPKLLSRYLETMRDHLNANRLQAYYRKAGRLPGIEEYVYGLRRSTSLVIPSLILLEYGLGIELDDETLASETMVQLIVAATDHIALANDVLSCKAEKSVGDYFNLPCVILRERAAAQPGFTFEDALQEALSMIEEVDKKCVQLIKEVENSELIEKAGVEAFLRGLETWMAGNLEWSLRSARYSHTCSAAR